MAITKIDSDLCVGCGVCVVACSVDVIRRTKGEKVPHIAYGEDCMLCQMCVWHCPANAIIVTTEMTQPVVMAWK